MPEIRVPADQVFPILESNILVDGFHLVIDLEKSQGSVMVDALTGKKYLDCYSYFASLPVGHNHPKMEDEEFCASLLRAAKSNPANSDVYSREYAGFVKAFREIAVPDPFRYLFFVAGGALAVENAMKAAFDWKVQKNRAAGVEGGGDKILHFREAFHGRSGYTMSVTNTDPLKVDDFPQFDWPRVSNPKIHFPLDDKAVAAEEKKSLEEIEAAFAADPHGIAGILLEPIQGEGGDNHFRPEFLRALRDAADRHEAPADLRRGADRARSHRNHVGIPAARRGPRPAELRQEDPGMRGHEHHPYRRCGEQRLPPVVPHQLHLGREPRRHGPLCALPADH